MKKTCLIKYKIKKSAPGGKRNGRAAAFAGGSGNFFCLVYNIYTWGKESFQNLVLDGLTTVKSKEKA
jgi:hypothetical protein